MKLQNEWRTRLAAGAAALCLVCGQTLTDGRVALGRQAQSASNGAAAAKTNASPVATTFEERVREYVKMRERLEDEKLPKLSKDAKPEEIDAHKTSFQELVRNARAGAKQGDLFTPEASALVRSIIKSEFKGSERAEWRETVLEAETKGVPVRVNYPYPASKELVEMPPTLLLKLPQLPKQMRYRFVGTNLLLVDRENGLIIDYMTNALP